MDRREFIKLGTTATLSIATLDTGLLSLAGDDFWELVLKRVESFQIMKAGYGEPHPIKDHYIVKHPPREGYLYSHGFFHLMVAKEWNITPSELSEYKLNDQIDMYAWLIALHQIQEVETWELQRKMKRRA